MENKVSMSINRLKITPKMSKEINCIRFFIPKNYDGCGVYDGPGVSSVEAYFQKTIYGRHVVINPNAEFNKLMQGVRWRGIHVHEMYEKGILEGSVPYYTLLEGLPLCVTEHIAKEMFKGVDKELILKIWKEVNEE